MQFYAFRKTSIRVILPEPRFRMTLTMLRRRDRFQSALSTPFSIALPRAVIPSEARNLSSLLLASSSTFNSELSTAGLEHAEGHRVMLDWRAPSLGAAALGTAA